MSTKVAVVTGANKGIGYAIVKGLCEKFNGIVYLTARNAERGEAAVKKLKELGFNPSFHQVDVDNQDSVDKFKNYINNTYGGLDLLVNNAGVGSDGPPNTTAYDIARNVINTNYFGLLRVSEAFIPLLRKDGKIVNISSSLGHLSKIPSSDLRNKFSDASLTVSKLSDLMNQFLKDFKGNVAQERGWGTKSYNVSKVGVSALTRVHQKLVNEEYGNKNISVNCAHPGYVSTDMTDHMGPLTIEEGAKSALYLALEANNLKGQYVWSDTRVVDWLASTTP